MFALTVDTPRRCFAGEDLGNMALEEAGGGVPMTPSRLDTNI
jgi:hypothetical protein